MSSRTLSGERNPKAHSHSPRVIFASRSIDLRGEGHSSPCLLTPPGAIAAIGRVAGSSPAGRHPGNFRSTNSHRPAPPPSRRSADEAALASDAPSPPWDQWPRPDRDTAATREWLSSPRSRYGCRHVRRASPEPATSASLAARRSRHATICMFIAAASVSRARLFSRRSCSTTPVSRCPRASR